MNSNLGLILKVLMASLLIAIAIKYLGPQLSVPATSSIALTAVLLPTIILAIALGWRGTREQG